MLDVDVPLEQVKEKLRSPVSPLSPSDHASRSSTPGLPSLDGLSGRTPPISLPPRPRSSPPSMEMVMKPGGLFVLGLAHHTEGNPPETPSPERNSLLENPVLPGVDNDPPAPRNAPSLTHVAHLLKSQRSHERQALQRDDLVHSLRVKAAGTSRLAHATHLLQKTLAECIRAEDKERFGAFLVEQPSKQSFRIRVHGRPDSSADEEKKSEEFYSQATDALLELLADPSNVSVIPNKALEMCRAIWTKLQTSPGHQRAFPHFILTRWLFSSFLVQVVTLPEVWLNYWIGKASTDDAKAFDIVSELHISDIARQRILHEVANRAQKIVFDVTYSWKYGTSVPSQAIHRVQAIMARLSSLQPLPHPKQFHDQCHRVTLPAIEVVRMIRALYPQRRPSSLLSDIDTLHSGVRSSASSVSGFSLFQNSAALPTITQMQPTWQYEAPKVGETHPETFNGPPSESTQATTQAEALASDAGQFLESAQILEDQLSLGSARTEWLSFDLRSETAECGTKPTKIKVERTHQRRVRQCIDIVNALVQDFEADEDINQYMPVEECYENLTQALERRIRSSEAIGDFLGAHHWLERLHQLQHLHTSEAIDSSMAIALEAMMSEAERSLEYSESTMQLYDQSLRLIQPSLDSDTAALKRFKNTLERLRNRMWFVSDVRTSAVYDEARCVAGALRVMGKPKRGAQTRAAPPLRHWSASRLTTSFHLKTEAQILEIMSALPHQGGPNKLSDDQARSTISWMDTNNIENLCRGEERLHRLSMEIRKCVERATGAESALLLSNALFTSWSPAPSATIAYRTFDRPMSGQAIGRRTDGLTLKTDVPGSIGSASSASYALSRTSSHDIFDSRSPTLTHRSSTPFWSPAVTEGNSASSATSIGSRTAPMMSHPSKTIPRSPQPVQNEMDRLKRDLTSFLLSDVASCLFVDGSETDHAFWSGLGGELSRDSLRNAPGPPNKMQEPAHAPHKKTERLPFDYSSSLSHMLRTFSAFTDPMSKLFKLDEISQLLALQIGVNDKLDEPYPTPGLRPYQRLAKNAHPSEDDLVSSFRKLFANPSLRPNTIFRDLQYIAALVPAQFLESMEQGKAFWNAAVAITQLKQDTCKFMVVTADSIIAYHSNNRGHGRSPSSAQQQRDSAAFTLSSRSSSAEDVSRYSMADAGYLLQITAREGNHVAQRELATLYLTNPDLMDHIVAPFARPRDVFKEELESKWRKNQDPSRCDPATMCVAHHWMSLSSKSGDALAKEYLRQREEMEKLP
ncbi:hypothetical protein KC332_g4902 [Hortaea werneckii]|nr:hypothetical protein KC350_g6071 [Hortaea werneckii]KAI6911859.1 hypothetical protein KC348_g12838 [Hortaea werneckii]KAI6936227.1 hypothetical protein KC341_g6371 [Hortaea werneckii]KAI7036533.1 hypothetical protein KC366_g7445 [Hortaea werneckii]KAI7037207.1 hypothetical protein KC362_g6925 [Hortaea werneckii]